MPSTKVSTEIYLSIGGTDMSTVSTIHMAGFTPNTDLIDFHGSGDVAHGQLKALFNHNWTTEVTLNDAAAMTILHGFMASATTTAVVIQFAGDDGGTGSGTNPSYSFNYQFHTVGETGGQHGERFLNITLGGDVDGSVVIDDGSSPITL